MEAGTLIVPHHVLGEASAVASARYPTASFSTLGQLADVQVGTGDWVAFFGLPTDPGDLILIAVAYSGAVGGLTVTDDEGNSYTAGPSSGGSGVTVTTFTSVAGTTASPVLTLHWTAFGTVQFNLSIFVLKGLPTALPLQYATAAGTSATASVTLPTSGLYDLVRFVFVGVPYTESETITGQDGSDTFITTDPLTVQEGGFMGVYGMDDTPAGSHTFDVDYSGAVPWAAVAVEYQGQRQ